MGQPLSFHQAQSQHSAHSQCPFDIRLDTRLARPSVTYCKLGAPESAVQGKTPLRYFDVPKEEGGVSRLVFEVIIGCRLEVTGILSSTTTPSHCQWHSAELAEWRVMSQHASGVTVFVTTSALVLFVRTLTQCVV